MPQDVAIGDGYCGEALFSRFPGQYRDPEAASAARGSGQGSFPGNHGPIYVDPDGGRPMQVKEVPGVGQVVVPVDHTVAAVYPSDHTMIGLGAAGTDDPKTVHGHAHWRDQLIQALNETAAMGNPAAQLTVAFGRIAQIVVQHALKKAKHGRFATADHAVQFVRDAIITSAKAFKPIVQTMAARVADATVKAAGAAIKKAWTAPSAAHKTGHSRRAMSDWPGSMMGLGQSQAFYSQVNQLQNQFIQMNWELNAIGSSVWDTAVDSNTDVIEGGGWTPYSNYFYDPVNQYVLSIIKGLIVTSDHIPSSSDLSTAQSQAAGLRKLIDTVKTLVPSDASQQADQAAADVQAKLAPMALKSPDQAASDSLKQSLIVDPAQSLVKYVTIAAVAVGAVALLPTIIKWVS